MSVTLTVLQTCTVQESLRCSDPMHTVENLPSKPITSCCKIPEINTYSRVLYDMSICGGMTQSPHSGVIGIAIPVNPKNSFPRLPFNTKFLRPYITVFEIRMAIFNPNCMYCTVSVESYVMLTSRFGNVSVCWHDSVECAVDFCGDISFDETVVQLAFPSYRLFEALKLRIVLWKLRRHAWGITLGRAKYFIMSVAPRPTTRDIRTLNCKTPDRRI